jgi:hypothetical protein
LSQVPEYPLVRGRFTVAKFWADDDLTRATPYEVLEGTNGRLCVGNGTTAASAGQTDLQGVSKTRKVFDGAPTVSGGAWTVVTTFTTTDANHSWDEAGIANAASGGVLLNRSLVGFGVKTSSVQWVLTATLTGIS